MFWGVFFFSVFNEHIDNVEVDWTSVEGVPVRPLQKLSSRGRRGEFWRDNISKKMMKCKCAVDSSIKIVNSNGVDANVNLICVSVGGYIVEK